MPSAFISIGKYVFFKKILGLSKAIGGFESSISLLENLSIPSISLKEFLGYGTFAIFCSKFHLQKASKESIES